MMSESKSDFFDTDEFADEITYIPAGGLPVIIEAIIDDEFPNQQEFERGETSFAIAILHGHVSDIPYPKSKDQYTARGYTWQVAPSGYQRSGDFYQVNLIREL